MSGAVAARGPAMDVPNALPSTPDVEPENSHLHLAKMAMAIWSARALYAAAHLGIADRLAERALELEEIARLTATHAPSLKRLLRALAGCCIVTEVAPNRFGLTKLGHALRSDAPGSARALVMTIAGDWQWGAWHNFLHSLRTGESGLIKSSGQDLFSYLAAHPTDLACFNEAMIGIHGAIAPAVAAAYEFDGFETIVDVGGGTGTLLTTILKATDRPRGVLFDLPDTAREAGKIIAREGLTDRCTTAAGDFFAALPEGHDCYIMSHVLHDWTDEPAHAILRNCRRAISRTGRLLIVDAVLPEGDTPHHGKLMDLLMLAVTGGTERTTQEFADLLSRAGFRLRKVIPTSTHQSIVEAVPM
jgi:ubiquinone/menaquinone biosynthesis C-methylase UbiE